MADEKIVHISGDNWESEVLKSDLPVLVDFWAEWCGPCRTIGPILEELASEMDGKIKIVKVNVDENQQLAGEFSVRSIPTLLIMKDGTVQDQMVGAMNKEALKEKVEANL